MNKNIFNWEDYTKTEFLQLKASSYKMQCYVLDLQVYFNILYIIIILTYA